MSPLDKLLPHLQRVRRTAPGKWIASCPTREDRSPSLAIRELDDGRLLLHDFGGEPVENIVAAVGLTLEDLFPERDPLRPSVKPERRPFNAVDLIDLAAFEAGVVCVIVADLTAGRDADMTRLLQAVGRLDDIKEAAHANH